MVAVIKNDASFYEAPGLAPNGEMRPAYGPEGGLFIPAEWGIRTLPVLPVVEHPCPYTNGELYSALEYHYGEVVSAGAGGVTFSTVNINPDAPISVLTHTIILRMKAQERRKLKIDFSVSGFSIDADSSLSANASARVMYRVKDKRSPTGYIYDHSGVDNITGVYHAYNDAGVLVEECASAELTIWLRYALLIEVSVLALKADGEHGVYGVNPGTVTLAFSGG